MSGAWDTLNAMRYCEQCGAGYEAGSGSTEDRTRRSRLTERFCSDACSIQWALEYDAEKPNHDR